MSVWAAGSSGRGEGALVTQDWNKPSDPAQSAEDRKARLAELVRLLEPHDQLQTDLATILGTGEINAEGLTKILLAAAKGWAASSEFSIEVVHGHRGVHVELFTKTTIEPTPLRRSA